MIGLTGGIGCGKSTVANMIREHGVPIVDADAIARVVVEPGQPAHEEIRREFGEDAIGPDGRIDRKRLGERVFRDAEARRRLEAITHPRIVEETRRRLEALGAQGHALAVYEAALLVETGSHSWIDGLVVVAASEETQLARLRERDGWSDDESRLRLGAQLPLARKMEMADWVIDNDGDLDTTRRQVDALVAELRAGGPAR